MKYKKAAKINKLNGEKTMYSGLKMCSRLIVVSSECRASAWPCDTARIENFLNSSFLRISNEKRKTSDRNKREKRQKAV
jgi:hypothetical protein